MIRKYGLPTMLVLVVFLIGTVSPSRAGSGLSRALVLSIQGEAEFLKAGSKEWMPLEPSAVLTEGDRVKTGKGSTVKLELGGNAKMAEVLVRPESEFSFAAFRHDEMAKTDRTLLDMEVGSILIQAEKLSGDSKFEVKTPTSTVGIRGTTFEVNVSHS